MKLLYVHYDWRYGGAAFAARRLAQKMSNNGHEVLFYDWRGYMNSDFQIIGRNSITVRFFSRLFLPYLNILIRKIFLHDQPFCLSLFSVGHSKIINDIGADVCHLHWTQNGFLSLRQINMINNVVITTHDAWWANGLFHLDTSNFSALRRMQCCRIQKLVSTKNIQFISPSNWLANMIKRNVDPAMNVHVIRNIVEYSEHSSVYDQPRHGVLFVSWVISSSKGAHDVMQLAEALENTNPKETLHIVGSVSTRLRSYIKKRFKNVRIWGRLTPAELEKLYASTKCVVYPSQFDNLPSVVIEAVKCGTPVVAYDVGGISEILTNGVNGYIVEKGDTKSLINHVSKYLINNIPMRQAIAVSLSEDFDTDYIFEATYNLYAEYYHEK